MKICIDAGHYKGYNVYPPFPKYNEGTQMWKIANKLKDKLQARGVEVIMTKNTEAENPTLAARGKKAANCDMFISLHSNASGSTISTVTGVECYRSIFNDGDTFAAGICEVVSKVMNTKNRGAKTRKGSGNRDYYSVMKNAVDVGCKRAYLLEQGFHTSEHDAKFLINDNDLDKLAEAECDYICEYFGIKPIEKPVEKPIEKPVEYKHKVGDNVKFDRCYVSSTTNKTVEAKIKHGTITKIITARNPYLINDGQCWLNDSCITGEYIEQKPKYRKFEITCVRIYIRRSPSLASARIGELKKGNIIEVDEIRGNWLHIVNKGWTCAGKYSREIK